MGIEVVDHGGEGLQREPSREDGRPAQDEPLLVAQQVVAPVEGGLQGLVSLPGSPAAAAEEPEPLLEPGGDVGHRQVAGAGRSQFDGQGDPVEVLADVGHDGLRGRVEDEVGPDGGGSFGEQLDRRGPVDQGRHPPHPLAVDAQRLAAGGEDGGPWRTVEHRLDHLGAGIEHVLAVVEQEQDVPVGECLDHGVDVVGRLAGGQAQCAGDRSQDAVVAARRHEVDEGDAAVVEQVGGDLEGEPGLPHAPDAGEGHERRGVEEREHVFDVVLAADQRGVLGGQVVLEGVERPERRVGAGVVDHHLVQGLRLQQVAQPVDAEIDELDGMHNLRRHRGRHHQLPAVGRRHDP